jgi:hypothetical protein
MDEPKEMKNNAFLKLIFHEEFSAAQKAFHKDKKDPMYIFVREPAYFDDIEWKYCDNISVWRTNETILSIGRTAHRQYDERSLCFQIYDDAEADDESIFNFAIFGKPFSSAFR